MLTSHIFVRIILYPITMYLNTKTCVQGVYMIKYSTPEWSLCNKVHSNVFYFCTVECTLFTNSNLICKEHLEGHPQKYTWMNIS